MLYQILNSVHREKNVAIIGNIICYATYKVCNWNMSNQNSQTPYCPRILKWILKIFGTAGLILSAFVLYYYYGYSYHVQNRDYSLMFEDGALTFDNEKLAWTVDNNGDNSTKLIKVYFNDNDTGGTIFASTLTDKNGKKLESRNIKFNDSTTLPIINSAGGWKTIRFEIDDYALERGSFQGWIILSGQETNYVPITISTKPILLVAIILVLIGVFSSICIWEVIRYYKFKSTDNTKNSLTQLLNQDEFNVALAPRERKESVSQNRNIVEQEIIQHNVQIAKYRTRNQEAGKSTFRITLIESVSALVGVAIGLFTLLNDSYVTGLLDIGAYETIILFGIGLGAGSLKELVDD
jgi:hypothetical protein